MTRSAKDPHRIAAQPSGPDGRYQLEGDSSTLLKQGNQLLSAAAARGLSPQSIRAYAFDLVLIIRWLAETNRAIDQQQQADVLAFMAAERDRGVQGRSINRRLTTFEALYQFVTGQQIPRGKGVFAPTPYYKARGYDRQLGLHRIPRPGQRALRAQTPQTLIAPLIPVQVNAFFQTLHRYRDLALVYLMLLCGLRSQEVLTINIDDIDSNDNTICVHGKGNKQRLLPLPSMAASTIAGYLRFERPRLCLTQRLFVVLQGRRRGCPMTPAGLRSLFRARRKQTLLQNANPHRLRHTFGADMARAGVSIPVLQRLMGHGDIKTTLGYINLSPHDIAEEFQRASDRIRKQYLE